MTATRNPDKAPPTDAPTVTKEWIYGMGESVSKEWRGRQDDIDDRYEEYKTLGEAGEGIAQLTYKNTEGKGTLMMRLARQGNLLPGYAEDITVIEELYAVDIIKDIWCAPYFSETVNAPKGLPLDVDEIGWVKTVVENHWESSIEIDAHAKNIAARQWANWNTGMKELRWHLDVGATSYFETGFILRRSMYGVRTSEIKASFTGINAVGADPEFQSAMDNLIESLPAGEWLYKPPQADHMGAGRWRITQEWHWADKWSIVYGGTWNGT